MWSTSHRAAALLLLLTVASAVQVRAQESDAAFSEQTRVTAVDVVIEVKRPDTLKVDDLTVRDDGQERPVVSIVPTADPDSEPWRIVVYFDLPLATSGTVQAAISALAEQAEALVGLGTVEVVVASPMPRQLLPPTRQSEQINQALSRLLLRLKDTDELNALRRAALTAANSPSAAIEVDVDPADTVRAEVDLVQRQQDEMLLWVAASDQIGGPRALFLVQDGFDLDPGAFYSAHLPGANNGRQARQFLSRTNADLAKSLSGYGWIVYALAFRDLVPDPEDRVSDFDRYRYRTMDGIDGETTALIPFTIKKKKNRKSGGASDTEFLLQDPLAPLQILTAATAGRLLDKSSALAEEIAALQERVLVTFQGVGGLDGRLRSLSIDAGKRPLRSPTWVRSGTPAPVAEARIRRLMGGSLEADVLVVSARWLPDGLLRVQIEHPHADDLLTFGPAVIRITFGKESADGSIRFEHVIDGHSETTADSWSLDAALDIAPSTERIVILVENLADGDWGAEALEPPRRYTGAGVHSPRFHRPAAGLAGGAVRCLQAVSRRVRCRGVPDPLDLPLRPAGDRLHAARGSGDPPRSSRRRWPRLARTYRRSTRRGDPREHPR